MNHLDLVKLTALMEHTSGRPEIMVALVDGPIARYRPDLESEHIREIAGSMHGTFAAAILCAKRGSDALAICANCTLLVHPIFGEIPSENGQIPSTTPEELAAAIIESVKAGARVLNLSLALLQPLSTGQRELEQALDYAARRGVIVVAAAGNQGTVGSSALTRHPWIIPVVACDLQGRLMRYSNLGSSIGRDGLGAPGEDVTSLGTDSKPLTLGGTSVAAPFVTGAIALLLSACPTATAAEVKLAVTHASAQRRKTVVPPLLDAWAAYQMMITTHERR